MSVRLFVLKPDNIGDFLIACGGIRALADAAGEENLVLAVKADVAPLVRREFSRAQVVPLPIRPRKKGVNTTAANISACLPALFQLARTRADFGICLRDKRTFLDTILWLAPRSARRVGCQSSLRRAKRGRWAVWENLVGKIFRPDLLPYPPPQPGLPSDLLAQGRLASHVLARPLAEAEIMPRLRCARWTGGDFWLMCPFSSRPAKDLPAPVWGAALRAVAELCPSGGIRLAGGPDQADRLANFAAELQACGLEVPIVVAPAVPLDQFPDTVAAPGLVLTVDTAAAHLACTVGAPAVIVASRKNEGVYAPYSPDGRQVWLMAGEGKSWREAVKAEDIAQAMRLVLLAR